MYINHYFKIAIFILSTLLRDWIKLFTTSNKNVRYYFISTFTSIYAGVIDV